MNTRELKRELAQHILDILPDYFDSNIYGCDLHNELFNTDYYIIGTYDAKKWLEKYDTFDCIELVREYEQSELGEVNTDFSDPERIVNMVVYIIGQELLNDTSVTDDDKWDNYLTKRDYKKIIRELREEYNII